MEAEDMNYRIGIDLGGSGIKAGVVDGNHKIIAKHSLPTESQNGFESVVRGMAQCAEAAAEKAGLKLTDFPCAGVGTPGSVSSRTGLLVFSNNTNWKNVPLRQELEKYIPVPVYINNDANCAIIGENVAGAANGHKNVIMLTLGTGVGGGVILDGKLFCGGDGMGAELGHTPLMTGGQLCSCTIPGCLEAYASVTALVRQTREAIAAHPESQMARWAEQHGRVSGRTAFECARAGDEAALQVVDTYETYVANGIGGLVNIFRPELVLIGGGMSNEGENLLQPIREKLPKFVFASDIIGVPPVERAALGNDAGIIGAAHLDTM